LRVFSRKIQRQDGRGPVDPLAVLVYNLEGIAVQSHTSAFLKLVRKLFCRRIGLGFLEEDPYPFEPQRELAVCVALNGYADGEIDRQGGR
jgi:hypothetical protein